MAHASQSGPDSDHGFRVIFLKPLYDVPSSLESGDLTTEGDGVGEDDWADGEGLGADWRQ